MAGLYQYVQAVLEWTEKHSGLTGWVGAVGAILAVFVTWGIARAEYNRARRRMIDARKSEISLLGGIVHEFEQLVQEYVKAALADGPEASSFYTRHLNDAQMHAARDLANVLVTQWPSLAVYAAFKRYWFFSLQVLETNNMHPINKDDMKKKLAEHDTWREILRDAFKSAETPRYL